LDVQAGSNPFLPLGSPETGSKSTGVFFIQNVAEELILLKKNDSDQGEADHRLALWALGMTNQPQSVKHIHIEDRKAQKLLEHIERKLALEAKATRDKAASSEN
jgi:hypothetical protein